MNTFDIELPVSFSNFDNYQKLPSSVKIKYQMDAQYSWSGIEGFSVSIPKQRIPITVELNQKLTRCFITIEKTSVNLDIQYSNLSEPLKPKSITIEHLETMDNEVKAKLTINF